MKPKNSDAASAVARASRGADGETVPNDGIGSTMDDPVVHRAALRNEAASACLCLLGNRVRALRVNLGMSQHALAAKAGMSPRFLLELEHGTVNVSVSYLVALAGVLGVSLSFLLATESEHDERSRLVHENSQMKARLQTLRRVLSDG